MAWFLFKNPILKRIEDSLWKKVETEVNERLRYNNLSPNAIKKEVKTQFNALFSEQRKVAKLALKPFKQIAEAKTREAVELTIRGSSPEWYSVENNNNSPVILAVPIHLVQKHVEFIFDSLLPERIEFKDLLPEARSAFATEAVAIYFSSEIKDCIKKRKEFPSHGFYPYNIRIADYLQQDHYYMGNEQKVSRNNMLILNCQSDKDAWEKEYKNNPEKRPNNRRFSSDAESKWQRLHP